MREIKFRAWDKKQDKMINMGTRFYKDIILMQYTGLKDKNGKKIYDGDIVRINLSFKAIGKVGYEKGMWVVYLPASWVILSTSSAELEAFPLWQFVVDDRAEVIGNIYENPELIGGKDERN